MNDTKNLAIFLALGIGVYFLLVKKSSASPYRGYEVSNYGNTNSTGQPKPQTNAQKINSLFGLADAGISFWDTWEGRLTRDKAQTAPSYVPDFSAANPSSNDFIGPKMPSYWNEL